MDIRLKERNALSTIFVALFVSTEAINLIVTRSFSVRNFMSAFYAVNCAGIVLSSFITRRAHIIKINLYHFICLTIVALYYLITYFVIGGNSLTLSYFVVGVLFPLIIPALTKVDVKLLLRIIFVIPSFGIFSASSIIFITSKNAMTMGDCYALLIPIIAALTYLIMFFKKDKHYTKILLLPCIIVNILYFVRILLYGSRGPILSIILCLIFLLLFRKDVYRGDKKRISIMIAFTIMISIFVFYFWNIMQIVSYVLLRLGISVRAIDKTYMLQQTMSIWNGRDDIFKVAIYGICESPIFGHGISTFLKNTGIIYPHNFLLQVLYDGGIILFIFLIIPLFTATIKMILHSNIFSFSLFFTLFFGSVPGALFTGDCWVNKCLWLLVGYIIAGKLPGHKEEYGEI